MKICQISSTFPPIKDGVGDSVAKLHRLLRLFSKNDSFVLTSRIVPDNEHIFNLINNWNLVEIVKSLLFLKKNKIDVIIFQYPTTFYYRKLFVTLIPLFIKILKMKVVLYLHEYSNYSVVGRLRILPMILFSDFIVTSDAVNFKKIVHYRGYNKTRIIPGGSNFSDEVFKLTSKTKQNRYIKRKILFFGFIRYGKGLENLVSIFCNGSNISDNFDLIIVGDVAENVDAMSKKLLNKIESSESIRYLGYLNENDLKSLSESIDIVFLPFSDGLSERRGSFMTAMGLGLPVVTTKPEIQINNLENFKNVIFISSSSYLEIEHILLKLLKVKSEKLQEVGKNAYDWYMRGYSDKKFIEKFLNVLKQLS